GPEKLRSGSALKLLVLAQAPSSLRTEIAYKDGAMRKETPFMKYVSRQNGGRRNRRLVDRTESDFQECNSDAGRGASCCRYSALLFSVVLLIKHAFDVVYGANEYPFTIFTVFALKAIGILLPMLVIIRTVAAIQSSLQHQFLESEEDALSSEEENDGLEEEEQQHHLA
ncbi:unnamed protein product, partial [Brassica napus]